MRWEGHAPAPPSAPAHDRPRDAGTFGGVRRYTDGTCVTPDGVDVRAAGEDVIPLPYARSEVRMRIGGYDVLGELGRGGMGVVYLAYSLRLCRHVALKMMTAGRFASEAETIRFQNEAMLAARLEHPHIVPVFDAGEHAGHLYFVMAYIPGRGFSALIEDQAKAASAERGPLLAAGVRCLAKAARALAYAHERGVVHRDIKPDNILVDALGDPHLTDFGIAKNVQRDVSLTRPGAIVGTPAYMAPEQANNIVDRVGPAADVYSLGATLYHLATGRAPFEGPSAIALVVQVLQKLPDPPRVVARKTLDRSLSPDLDLIIQKAMEKRAADRYPSAAALADDLEAWLEDRPVSARPIGALERTKKLLRRNRAAFAMAFVALLTLIALAVGFGTVLAFNLSRTSESLREHDAEAALEQAGTLERAIVANMIEGRADVVRNLIGKLREAPGLSLVEVVRTDKTLAYTDRKTREGVARRLMDPAVRAAITKVDPGFERQIEMLEELAFARIDRADAPEIAPTFPVDDTLWRELLGKREPLTRMESVGGVPHLTVMKPIPNGPTCQFCHGPIEERPDAATANPYADLYGSATPDPENRTRAVLVVRRSQAEVEAKIAANSRDTILVGAGTTLALIALLWLAARLFGIRLRPERYG